MRNGEGTPLRIGLVIMLALSASLAAGCTDEVQQTILTATESGVKTIVDGLVSALFVAFSSSRGGF